MIFPLWVFDDVIITMTTAKTLQSMKSLSVCTTPRLLFWVRLKNVNANRNLKKATVNPPPYTKLTELQVGKHTFYRRSQLTLFVGVQDGGLKNVALSGLTDVGSWRDIESLETLSVWLTSWNVVGKKIKIKNRLTSRIWLDGRNTSVAVVINAELCSSLLAREQIIKVLSFIRMLLDKTARHINTGNM